MNAFGICVMLTAVAGCAGYQLGNRSLYRGDVRTVYVPIIRNDTFREDLGVRLTEALQKAIEQRTPFKVTGDPNADSVLTCRVVGDNKQVLTETDTDEPRALDNAISIEAAWVNRQGTVLMENPNPLPPVEWRLYFRQSSRMVPRPDRQTQPRFKMLSRPRRPNRQSNGNPLVSEWLRLF
ncbi:MAG: LPS assembly lipoprotein LptE [Pirellulaceae bacterium]